MDDNTYCATIGFFDGVHIGHRFVIDRLNSMAREAGMRPMVITFDRHPREVVQPGYAPLLITPLPEKLRLLRQACGGRVEVLHFDAQMACLSARDFMRQVLFEKLGVRRLLIGYDNRFGHNRSEEFDDYVRYGREMGMKVERNTPVDVGGMRVSSSLVRRMLAAGDVCGAARCLGRRFAVDGTVEHGFGEGRKIGFPTANIHPVYAGQILPAHGVYDVTVAVDGMAPRRAMMNIGTNPTFGRVQTTLEAHIFNFDADIYGSRVRVEFGHRMRGECRFNSIDELCAQLRKDRAAILSRPF